MVLHNIQTIEENIQPICSSLSLNCFDFGGVLQFALFTVVLPYCLYGAAAEMFNFTKRRKKTDHSHLESILSACMMSVPLYIMGNYEGTFNTTTVLYLYTGLILFTVVSETTNTQHQTISKRSNWSKHMQCIVAMATIVLFLTFLYHISLAKEVSDSFQVKYVVAAITVFFVLVKMHESDKYHLHHAHLFYILAFFTRFPTTLSRIAAGLFLGSSIHGIAAFGSDSIYDD